MKTVNGKMPTTSDLTLKAMRLSKVNGLLSSLKEEKELLEAELVSAMTKDAENEEYFQYIEDSNGIIICEYKSRKGSHFDSTKFKVDEPSKYEQYMKREVYWGVKSYK